MSPELIRRAQREARHTQRLAQADRWARYPLDYYRPVDRTMIPWLRAATPAAWRTRTAWGTWRTQS